MSEPGPEDGDSDRNPVQPAAQALAVRPGQDRPEDSGQLGQQVDVSGRRVEDKDPFLTHRPRRAVTMRSDRQTFSLAFETLALFRIRFGFVFRSLALFLIPS
jgi:hypothetical protein